MYIDRFEIEEIIYNDYINLSNKNFRDNSKAYNNFYGYNDVNYNQKFEYKDNYFEIEDNADIYIPQSIIIESPTDDFCLNSVCIKIDDNEIYKFTIQELSVLCRCYRMSINYDNNQTKRIKYVIPWNELGLLNLFRMRSLHHHNKYIILSYNGDFQKGILNTKTIFHHPNIITDISLSELVLPLFKLQIKKIISNQYNEINFSGLINGFYIRSDEISDLFIKSIIITDKDYLNYERCYFGNNFEVIKINSNHYFLLFNRNIYDTMISFRDYKDYDKNKEESDNYFTKIINYFSNPYSTFNLPPYEKRHIDLSVYDRLYIKIICNHDNIYVGVRSFDKTFVRCMDGLCSLDIDN